MTFTSLCLSHGNHKSINTDEAKGIAQETIVKLTEQDAGLPFGKLPKSWAEVKESEIVVVQQVKGFYLVNVLNKQLNKTLTLLIAGNGEVYDANFSGKFEGIN
jgi:hypothetical protein